MEKTLLLKPEHYSPIEVFLSDVEQSYTVEKIILVENRVYDDVAYSASLCGFDDVSEVQVLINGESTASWIDQDGIIRFENQGYIFKGIFGFAQITVIVRTNEKTEYGYSDFLSVMIRDRGLNTLVQKMLHYIYERQSDILHKDTRVIGSIVESSNVIQHDLLSILVMLENIASVYENYYGFFKMNSSFELRQEEVIDRIERLKHVNSSTVQYVAGHPEHLVQATGGIAYEGKHYLPQKTIMSQNRYTYDIFENRVVVSFICYLQEEATKLCNELSKLYIDDQIPEEEENGYITSSYIIYKAAKNSIEVMKNRAAGLSAHLESLFIRYQNCLRVKLIDGSQIPYATKIFHSVLQYHHLYACILQWHQKSGYDFAKEKRMMNFSNSSDIYEYYVLAKLLSSIQEQGYTCISSQYFDYGLSDCRQFKAKDCNNEYVFEKEKRRITLFYEPVITCDPGRTGLYRNNTHSLAGEYDNVRSGDYYTPDFVIKTEDESVDACYYIADAKFCKREHVLVREIPKLSYKYLLSISTQNVSEKIQGLCVFYGKAYEGTELEDFFDRSINRISPEVLLIPVNPDVEAGILNWLE